jgi:hypothetical protein
VISSPVRMFCWKNSSGIPVVAVLHVRGELVLWRYKDERTWHF